MRQKALFVSPDMGPACLYIGKLLRQMKVANRGVPLVAVEIF